MLEALKVLGIGTQQTIALQVHAKPTQYPDAIG
jgi:hypothetical protein